MPNIADINTIKAIAQAFVVNGLVKSKALITAGYSKHYARAGKGLALFNDDRVIAEIAQVQSEARIKAGTTIEDVERMYDEDRTLARALKQPAAAISAVTGIARLYGLDKDAHSGAEQPAELNPSDIQELKELAKHGTTIIMRKEIALIEGKRE